MSVVDLINIITALSMLASAICAATPTPKDDAMYAKWVYPVIEMIALNIGKAKE